MRTVDKPTLSLANQLSDTRFGSLAMRIFLWLLSVAAALGLLSLYVLRPSLEFTSKSTGPSISSPAKETSLGNQVGAVCSFPNLEEI